MNLLGYRITSVDGLLGPQTKRALEAYKRDKQLEQDIPNDEVYRLIAEDTYLKILNELKRLTAGMGRPLM